MAFFSVKATDPKNYSANFPISGTMYVTFSKDVKLESINDFTVYLTEDRDDIHIPIERNYNREELTLEVTPKSFLEYGKTYTLTLVGTANFSLPVADDVAIKSTDGDVLYPSYYLYFRTEEYEEQEEEEQEEAIVTPEEYIEEIETTTFKVIGSAPEDGAFNIDLKKDFNNSIFLYLNDDLASEYVGAYFNGAVLGDDYYGNVSDLLYDAIVVYRSHILSSSVEIITPLEIEYVEYLKAIKIVLKDEDVLPNYEYTVVVSRGGIAGENYGTFTYEFKMSFTTLYSPLYVDPMLILMEISEAVPNIDMDSIYRVIVEDSLDAADKNIIPLPTTSGIITYYNVRLNEKQKQYIICKVKYDILRNIALGRSFGQGRKRLGDFEVTVDVDPRALLPLLDKFEECWTGALVAMKIDKFVRAPIISKNDPRAPWQVWPDRGYRHTGGFRKQRTNWTYHARRIEGEEY